MTQQPQPNYCRYYRAPDYMITDIHLDFDLEAENTTVMVISTVVRQGKAGAPLPLNSEDLRLLSLRVMTIRNGRIIAWKPRDCSLSSCPPPLP